MARQNCTDNISMTASLDEQTALALQNPKVYTSVSEMKRIKQQKFGGKSSCDAEYEPDTFQIVAPMMKSFNSSPNLQTASSSVQENGQIYANGEYGDRNNSSISLQRKKVIIRPKTPPPPPPAINGGRREFLENGVRFDRSYDENLDRNYEKALARNYERSMERARSVSSPSRPLKKSNGCLSVYQKKMSMTPPPYDPIGANGRNSNRVRYEDEQQFDVEDDDNEVTNIQVPSPNDEMESLSSHKLCITVKRSITPDKFMISPKQSSRNGVDVESVSFSPPPPENSNTIRSTGSVTNDKTLSRSNSQSASRLDFNFNSDLQNAVAKRRSLLENHCQSPQQQTPTKEISRENGSILLHQTARNDNDHVKIHRADTVSSKKASSPPKIAPPEFGKKDSGYASSRNSLERSDYGEDSLQRHGYANESLQRDYLARHKMTGVNNNQLEENNNSSKLIVTY